MLSLARLGTRVTLGFSAAGLPGVPAAPPAVANLYPVVGEDALHLATQGHRSLQVCEYRPQVKHRYLLLSCRFGGERSAELRRVSLRERRPATAIPLELAQHVPSDGHQLQL